MNNENGIAKVTPFVDSLLHTITTRPRTLLSLICLSACSANAESPKLAPYRSVTGIENYPFTSAPPAVRAGDFPLIWSLQGGPPGLTIDPQSGWMEWLEPEEGQYFIRTIATNLHGATSVEWSLTIIPDVVATPQLIRTKYFDYVVDPTLADWMRDNGAEAVFDASWEYLRDLVGLEPGSFRGGQIYRQDPAFGGTSSGNPSRFGIAWENDPIDGWRAAGLGFVISWNFMSQTNMNRISAENWADAFYFGLTPFPMALLVEQPYLHPRDYGLFGAPATAFALFRNAEDVERFQGAQPYMDWLAGGGRAQDYAGNGTPAWHWITRVIRDEYGIAALENTIRLLRRDGVDASLYELADTPLRKNTLLFSIISAAAGADLRGFFDAWGFDSDHAFWNQVHPQVHHALLALPDVDVRGWKFCPDTGTYLRRTPWKTVWHEAERIADRFAGHLVTVSDQAMHDWLRSRFGTVDNHHIGLTDELLEGTWFWTSGAAVTFELWNVNQPSNTGGVEHYAAMNANDATGAWNDVRDDIAYWGLIESSSPFTFNFDTNADGQIDFDDAQFLMQAMLGPQRGANAGSLIYKDFIRADLDGDWDVDLQDFATLQRSHSSCDSVRDLGLTEL